MEIGELTRRYEHWLGSCIPLVAADLDQKHVRMADGAFPFFRATYYRWLVRLETLPAALREGPRVASVGDLHVENFGTWSVAPARPVPGPAAPVRWGVNDLDELGVLPWSNDLLRLATSAELARRAGHLPLGRAATLEALLEGYREGLAAAALEPLRPGADVPGPAAAIAPERFWAGLARLPDATPPLAEPAFAALARPLLALAPRWQRRTAGVGSLGRRRLVASGTLADGSHWARELKQTAAPTAAFLATLVGEPLARPLARVPAPGTLGQLADPSRQARRGWVCRVLDPAASKLELGDYHRGGERRLLVAMGRATALLQRSLGADATAFASSFERHGPLLARAVATLADDAEHDWHHWRHQQRG